MGYLPAEGRESECISAASGGTLYGLGTLLGMLPERDSRKGMVEGSPIG